MATGMKAPARPRRPMKREEDALQKAQVEYLERLRAQGRLEYYAVPNGGLRSKKEAAIMKGLGVRSGVPDLVLLWSTPFMGGTGTPIPQCAYIENKRSGGTRSDNQKKWGSWLTSHGNRYAVVSSFDQFMVWLRRWELISEREFGGIQL